MLTSKSLHYIRRWANRRSCSPSPRFDARRRSALEPLELRTLLSTISPIAANAAQTLSFQPVFPLGSLVYESASPNLPTGSSSFTVQLDEALEQTVSVQTTSGTIHSVPTEIQLQHPNLGSPPGTPVLFDSSNPPKLTGGTLTIDVQAETQYDLSVLLNAMHDQGDETAQNLDGYFTTMAASSEYPSIVHDASRVAVIGRTTSQITDALAEDPQSQLFLIESFEPTSDRPDPLKDYSYTGKRRGVELTTDVSHDGSYALEQGASRGSFVYRDDDAIRIRRDQGATISTWMMTPGGKLFFGFGSTKQGTLSLTVGSPRESLGTEREVEVQGNPGYSINGYSNVSSLVLSEIDTSLERNVWYRLEADWRPSGEIIGNVYDADGDLVNRILAFDDTVSEGGFGFATFNNPMIFDEVHSAPAPLPDVYQFTVDAGQTATVTLASLTGDRFGLRLDDVPVADEVQDAQSWSVGPGTHEVDIVGGANAEYSLVVTRNMHFEHAATTPQDLNTIPVALGAITPELAPGIQVLESFEDGNWAGYFELNTTDVKQVTNEAAYADGRLGLSTTGWMSRGDEWTQPGDVVSVWFRPTDVSQGDSAFGIGWEQTRKNRWVTNALSVGMDYPTGEMWLERKGGKKGPVELDRTTLTSGFEADTWYRLQIEWTTGGDVDVQLYDDAGTLLAMDDDLRAIGAGTFVGGIGLNGSSSSPTHFDSVLLAPGAAGTAIGGTPAFYEAPATDEYLLDANKTIEVVTPGGAFGAFDNELIPVVDVIDSGGGTNTATIYGADDTLGEYVLIDPPANRVDTLVGSAILVERIETSFALRTTEGEQPQPTQRRERALVARDQILAQLAIEHDHTRWIAELVLHDEDLDLGIEPLIQEKLIGDLAESWLQDCEI